MAGGNPIRLSAAGESLSPAGLGWHAEHAGFLTGHRESDTSLLKAQSLGH